VPAWFAYRWFSAGLGGLPNKMKVEIEHGDNHPAGRCNLSQGEQSQQSDSRLAEAVAAVQSTNISISFLTRAQTKESSEHKAHCQGHTLLP
jgi:hypothetical protein